KNDESTDPSSGRQIRQVAVDGFQFGQCPPALVSCLCPTYQDEEEQEPEDEDVLGTTARRIELDDRLHDADADAAGKRERERLHPPDHAGGEGFEQKAGAER